jgi:hypothetical protein
MVPVDVRLDVGAIRVHGGVPLALGAARLGRVQRALDRRRCGVVVLVFQDGVGSSLLGVDGEVPIVSFVSLLFISPSCSGSRWTTTSSCSRASARST